MIMHGEQSDELFLLLWFRSSINLSISISGKNKTKTKKEQKKPNKHKHNKTVKQTNQSKHRVHCSQHPRNLTHQSGLAL